MRRAVTFLSLTTGFFVASTLWLLIEHLRDRSAAAVTPAPAVRVESSAGDETRTAAQDQAPPPATVPVAEPESRPANVARYPRPKLGALDRKFLQEIQDPERRDQLLEDMGDGLRDSQGPLREILGLDAGSYAQLVELQAEHDLRVRESFLRCIDDVTCDLQAQRPAYVFDDSDIAALLGPEKRQRFEDHQLSLVERNLVAALRGRLSDSNALSDVNAEQLITALAAERRQREAELIASSRTPNIMGNFLPLAYSPGDTREALIADARAYYDDLRKRAARILTPAQLVVFDRLQKQHLGGTEYAIDSYLENLKREP